MLSKKLDLKYLLENELDVVESYLRRQNEECFYFEDEIEGFSTKADILKLFIYKYYLSILNASYLPDDAINSQLSTYKLWFDVTGKPYFIKVINYLKDGPVVNDITFKKIVCYYNFLLDHSFESGDLDLLLNWLYDIPGAIYDKLVDFGYISETMSLERAYLDAALTSYTFTYMIAPQVIFKGRPAELQVLLL